MDDAVDAAHRLAIAADEDSYRDPMTGFEVFTSEYLRRRGSCCGSVCRHCPYPQISDEGEQGPDRRELRSPP